VALTQKQGRVVDQPDREDEALAHRGPSAILHQEGRNRKRSAPDFAGTKGE